ncbi:MAG: ubiquinol-cytochrome c reductase iron-sulfur subunit [Aquificaceae bacterium]
MESSRRDFLGMAVMGMGLTGLAFALYPFVMSLAPSAASLQGARVEVDINSLPEGQVRVFSWKGKPVFVVKLPQGFSWGGSVRSAQNQSLLKGQDVYAMIAVCTHLGCVPIWKPQGEGDFKFPVFHCPCHGGYYSPWGDVIAGPPPKSLSLPPQSREANKLVIGQEGFIKEQT